MDNLDKDTSNLKPARQPEINERVLLAEMQLREIRLSKRVTKYSSDIVKKICSHVENGLTAKDSCIIENVDEATFYEWVKDPSKEELPRAIKKAEQDFKESNLKIIRTHAMKNWFAAAWLVERKFPDEWALKSKLEMSGYLEQNESDKEKMNRVQSLKKFLNQVKPDNKKKEEPKQAVAA